jgi:3-hydroxymyristoyl/3-hydroxydecanoyl-(acyl carrier protein) dehydratase
MAQSLEVIAALDWNPRYRGTSHEDETARAMGFRGALLPGVFVYGHAMRLAVRAWGEDWLARGTAQVRFRRPVHAGDPLQVSCTAPERGDSGLEAAVTVRNTATGDVVLDGSFGLADNPTAPGDLPVLPSIEPRVEIRPGAVPVGLQLGAPDTVLDAALVAQSLAEFHETEPVYATRRLIHSGCLIRKTMGDALGNLTLPMPVIFAGLTVQNLAPAPVGASYRTSAQITRAWDARGKHYFETDEWLLADGQPVARHIRHNLYAMDKP